MKLQNIHRILDIVASRTVWDYLAQGQGTASDPSTPHPSHGSRYTHTLSFIDFWQKTYYCFGTFQNVVSGDLFCIIQNSVQEYVQYNCSLRVKFQKLHLRIAYLEVNGVTKGETQDVCSC